MIFNTFDETDIVAGRTSAVASGFWPDGVTFWSASYLVDDFYELTQSAATPSPAYGSSIYDVRRTAYYLNVFPDETYHANNDAYFSVAYGNYAGNLGSGSFNLDTASMLVFPPKAVYTQYKNLLLGTADIDGKFSFKSGSSDSVDGDDIFVINFSSYKMKDKVDEGIFEISLTGSNGRFVFRDDSPFLTQASNVYNLITGSINDQSAVLPAYQGLGLLYPNDGVVVFNAQTINRLVGLTNLSGAVGAVTICPAGYSTASINTITVASTSGPQTVSTTINHKVFFWCIQNSNADMKVRKTELVPARHYFVRVKNRDFNYSNNPTYVYDGTEDNVHARGTIRNEDFISDPRTYITTIGLYNDNNELVAVAKLSRPALKSFDNELLVKVRLDF